MIQQNREEVKNQMFSHIAQWKSSNQSPKSYCRDHNIRYHVFHHYFKKYRDEGVEKKNNIPAFAKVQVDQSMRATYAELILADGRRLVFHEPVGSDFLKALIS